MRLRVLPAVTAFLFLLAACGVQEEPARSPEPETTVETASATGDEPDMETSTFEDLVPGVTGMTGAEAGAVLADIDVTVRFVEQSSQAEVDPADAAERLVMSTYPGRNSPVPADRQISVFLYDVPETVTPTPEAPAPTPEPEAELDLTTDEGLCAADAELTNLELNDAIAPILGYPADRDARTFDQDEAIREYKNAAFGRACPERAS